MGKKINLAINKNKNNTNIYEDIIDMNIRIKNFLKKESNNK